MIDITMQCTLNINMAETSLINEPFQNVKKIL